MTSLNPTSRTLAANLAAVYSREAANTATQARGEKINVVGAGGVLTAAYEQLRNAAENTEEHLLLQNAIRRFFRQLFITRDDGLIAQSGNELAVELTLAGYVPNDSLTKLQVEQISELARKYYRLYEQLYDRRGISNDSANAWSLDVLAVEVEALVNDHGRDSLFVQFAHDQMSNSLSQQMASEKSGDDSSVALYIAIHRALLKSNPSVIRAGLLARYKLDVGNLDTYVNYNKQLDRILEADSTDKLFHLVDRQGAPLRILRHMIDNRPNLDQLLPNRTAFLDEYEKQINEEYSRVAARINRAIVRSVIFLIITKFLIGIAIEVPYDYFAHGGILWLPLIINLLFPPLYMLALRATHRLPGYANTSALVDRIDAMLYGDQTQLSRTRQRSRSYGPLFSVMYVLVSMMIFVGVMSGLLLLNFSLVHIAIFFVFLSAASFLGFRLSRLIRELEVVRGAQNGMTFVRDLLYLPFVVVGRWMSDKYSQVNIVTIVLDMLIELPLKTILRLVRQWGAFIDDRKDQI